jgi:hypothetical protein
MNLKHCSILILLCVPLCTSGCVFAYKSLDTTTGEKSQGFRGTNSCQITYAIKADWKYRSWEYKRLPDHEKNNDFERPPYLNDYAKWVDTTISDLGCKAVHADSNIKPDLTLEITDQYPYDVGVGQAERFLATLTLFVIPIPVEPIKHRSYVFSSGESTRRIGVVEKIWLGWIFVPVSLLSLYPYEENIFKTQLREYLLGR